MPYKRTMIKVLRIKYLNNNSVASVVSALVMQDKIFIYLPGFWQNNVILIVTDKALSTETPSSFTTDYEFMTVPLTYIQPVTSCLPNRMS